MFRPACGEDVPAFETENCMPDDCPEGIGNSCEPNCDGTVGGTAIKG